MNLRKILRRTVSMLFGISIMFFSAVTHAEIYSGEGSYIMSEGENLGVAKERAKADAMQNAAEKAGTYVKSYARSKNFELEELIIETMTANILKLIESPDFSPLKELDNLEGVLIHVVVKVQIDDSDINRWLDKDEQEKSELVAQMEALRKANEEQAHQIEELKRLLANNPQDKERITQAFAAEDKIFLSNQKVGEGWKLWEKKDFNGAEKLFDEAIELNPNNEEAWRGRGVVYADGSNQHERAIQAFNKAIEINPNYANAYFNRANVYNVLKQYKRAIQDFDKVITFNPKSRKAYNNRGVTYGILKQYERAIQDYDKAIQFNPNFDWAYNNRGRAYMQLKQYEQAIKDFDKALKLNPNYTTAKNNRELCYKALGK